MANYNPNKAKINRSYTFEELALVFGIHKNTVASWVKNGLPCLKERKPFLVLGSDIRTYLQAQRRNKKQKCKPNELFCMSCKKPVKPAENFVEYVPISQTRGRITGFCCHCENVVNKFVGCDCLVAYGRIFDLSIPKGLEHISDSDSAL